jgi:hypothetical protein
MCGCKGKKTSSTTTMNAYKQKNAIVKTTNFNSPSKSKEQLRLELIERMRKVTGGKV